MPHGHAALTALVVLARLHHLPGDATQLRHHLGLAPSEAVGQEHLLLAARHLGLKAKLSRSTPERLPMAALPALAFLRDGSVALLAQCSPERVLLQVFADASSPPQQTALDDFAAAWTGELLLVSSRASLAGELARFDFSWFIPSLVRHRTLLGEVLLVSTFLQVIGLLTPLFFQVVMDKVLVHRASSTLNVLVTALVVVMLFESVLSVLRAYVLSHTTSRIDVELGSRLYRHLLALPLSYFESRRVGDSVARVRELENIRAFLTGPALMLVLDVVFSVVFIGVMFMYSTTLTLIVLASLPLYVLISVLVVPVLRKRLDEKFARGAENQALLVESISGVQTVKASALEPALARRWDNQLAAYVSASFRTQTLATGAHEAVGLVGKLVSAAVLWFGAHAVMQQEMTVGMFVAFTMFANRVAQPIMRIAQMWTDFQQTGLSVQRLGDILNTRTEAPPAAAAQLPALAGRIEFENVRFRYRPDAPPVLHELSLQLRAGEVLGVVGRSGSGKSTLAKLVQRLYVPESGRVRVDGVDLSLIDAGQLRRQVGVVLQENQLFNRSVRENIAISDPAAPLEDVMRVAKLAGAHEFICELPQGYDTVVGEHGTGLSGGQRQRIAIARALFGNPRILIFDEATSALDYESEAILQRNMAAICAGRTVIIIAHRLSAVRRCHRIVAMHQGRIVEAGSHDQLLARQGLYAHLWSLQQGASPLKPGQPAAGAA
ncbi:MAG: type I secretion system permease/ATPase [Rubrivivax sp.]|nr:type I secretion system permease/ATPase [Rubrivivax sp.]